MMSDRPLLVTTTGEPFQPARLHYSVGDGQRLETCFRKLRCMGFDESRKRWVWHYDDEARTLKFKESWKDVSKHGAVVLGSFYIRGTNAAELYVRSIERALMAVTFFDRYVPRTVARIHDMDVANRLFTADERDLTPETVFAAAEADLRRQAVEREALLADPQRMIADFQQQYSGGEQKQLPELERIPTNFYGDGIKSLTHTLKLRQLLAMAHWTGDHDLTMLDLIREAVSGATTSASHVSPESPAPSRIDWNFGPEVPVRDFFEALDLPFDLSEAVENFIFNMAKDEFRTWEAVIREEQGLATMPVLTGLADELMSFGDVDEDDPVLYINGTERCSEPWYELLRRIASHLLIEPFRTADGHDDVLLDGWPRIAAWVERRARGLSLPEGVCRPLDVVPEELRHPLWLQFCCNPLCGLGQAEGLTLADEEEHWRIDQFLKLLHRHRESVESLGLTLDSLLQRCELPESDRPIFIRMVTDRLALSGTDELLARKLGLAAGSADEPGEPIQRLSEDNIRQAILHSEPAVHRAAMWYFAGADSLDPGIAPLVIQSIQAMKSDRDRTFAYLYLKRLVQSDETSEKILKQLKALRSAGDDSDDYRHAVAWALLEASHSFLASNKQTILSALPEFDPMLHGDLEARISDGKLDVDDRWDRFVDLVESEYDDQDYFYPRRALVERVERLIRGMGDDQRPVRWAMETLRRTVNDENYTCDRELIAANLSGALRLNEATPYLIALLHDNDPIMVERAVRSLSRIGGDAVIDGVDRWFADAGPHFRLQAATVLQHIHSDHSIRTLQGWSRTAKDESAQCRAQQALLGKFVTSEIDRVLEWMIEAAPTCDEAGGLRRILVANSLVTGRDFAELDDWLAIVRQDLDSEPYTGDWSDEDDAWDEDEEDWDEDFDDSGDPLVLSRPGLVADDPIADRDLSPIYETHAAPIVNSGQKVGRNDPCPCGSGKKYKKCCLRKQ